MKEIPLHTLPPSVVVSMVAVAGEPQRGSVGALSDSKDTMAKVGVKSAMKAILKAGEDAPHWLQHRGIRLAPGVTPPRSDIHWNRRKQ